MIKIFFKTGCISVLFLLLACGEEELRFPPITEDYCAEIRPELFEPLSLQLADYKDSALTKTGTYSLEEGDQSMVFRAWLSESAEKTMDIQYFIFSSDNIGLIAVDFLLRAAERGVKVRLMVDDIMVEADADELLALDAHPNLSIKIYNPSANLGKNLPQKLYGLSTDFRGFNQRMHNKTFIVDDLVVITGGRNIANEYFDYDHEYNFRDRDVLLLGEAVKEVSQSFNEFWNSDLSISISEILEATEEEINKEIKYEYLRQYACNPSNFSLEVREKINNTPQLFKELVNTKALIWVDKVSFVSDKPGKNKGDAGLKGGGLSTDSLIALINRAQKTINIQSPYLITTALSQGLFKQAINRGVQIKILTNSLNSTDNLEAFSGYKREREALLDLGVEIYEFKPDASIRYEVMTSSLQKEINYTPVFGLHAKSMVIDEEISVIGTFNLDPRSANLNTECIAIIHDSTISKRLHRVMEDENKIENAWRISSSFNPDSKATYGKRFQLWLRGVVPKSIL